MTVAAEVRSHSIIVLAGNSPNFPHTGFPWNHGNRRRTGPDRRGQRGTVVAIGRRAASPVSFTVHNTPLPIYPLGGIAMTLKPIPGAPIGAPIPIFQPANRSTGCPGIPVYAPPC